MIKIAASIILIIFFSLGTIFSSEDSNLYFNAGTEKYLQGNFAEAVENLEKAQKLDPSNAKIREFIIKILIEATTQAHMNRNYRQALEYISRANAFAPQNQRVQELYKLTNDLMNTAQEYNKPGESKERKSYPEPQTQVTKQYKPAVKAEAPVKRTAEQRAPLNAVYRDKSNDYKIRYFFIFAGAASVFFLGFIVLLASLIIESISLKKVRASLLKVEEEFKTLSKEKNNVSIELEKHKEKIKYEHQIAEQFRVELKQRSRKEEERLKIELEQKTRQIEERLRSEMIAKYGRNAAPQEAFFHQQQARILEILDGDISTGEFASPALESARERIAAMAQNLYEYAPGSALDFLKKMSKNENPQIRSNVVRALALIANPDTIKILFDLYNDSDSTVKREVLKNFKTMAGRTNFDKTSLSASDQEKILNCLNDE